jgi:hypothetical protein
MTIEEFLRSRAAGDEAVEQLLKEITSFQQRTATRIAGLLGDLEIVNGSLVASPANMARLSTVIAELEANFADPKWQKAVGEYLASFTELETGIVGYSEALGSVDAALLTSLKVQYQTVAGNYLLNATSFTRTLQQPIVQEVGSYIAQGGRYRDLVASVSDIVTGGDVSDGAILGNARTAVNDMVSIYERTATNAAATSVGAEFFVYQGRPIDTTRDFCRAREGRAWHKEEVESWGHLEWAGQIPGTNSTTIFSLLGGYQCRHVLVPVARRDVPKDDLARMKQKGYID